MKNASLENSIEYTTVQEAVHYSCGENGNCLVLDDET